MGIFITFKNADSKVMSTNPGMTTVLYPRSEVNVLR